MVGATEQDVIPGDRKAGGHSQSSKRGYLDTNAKCGQSLRIRRKDYEHVSFE